MHSYAVALTRLPVIHLSQPRNLSKIPFRKLMILH